MTTDATTQLIKMIQSGGDQDFNTTVIGQTTSILGAAANYAQLLGAAEGPIAQALALLAVSSSESVTGAAGQAALLTAGATTAGIGAGIVLLLAFVLAGIAGSSKSQSADSQEESELINAINSLAKGILADYWQSTLGPIGSAWTNLGDDLDNLAAQGTIGSNVTPKVGNYHDDAMGFVNFFITSPVAFMYWQRPFDESDPSQVFTPPQLNEFGFFPGWYGTLPVPQGAPSAANVPDPRTILPFVALGLRSYLKIQMLVYFIAPLTQQPFDAFLSQYGGDLAGYLSFLYPQYSLAVKGIVKSDIPSQTDLLSWLYQQVNVIFADYHPGHTVAIDPDYSTNAPYWGGSPPPSEPSSVPHAGNGWSGVYGAVETYPPYGVYPQAFSPSGLNLSSCSTSCFISAIDVGWSFNPTPDNLMSEFYQTLVIFKEGSDPYISSAKLGSWVFPWVQNRVILGTMARWKAIYLINGYDQVWSILQTLEGLVNPGSPILPPTMTLGDGTIASGNWSARELSTVLKVEGDLLDGVAIDTPAAGFVIYADGAHGYSLFALVQFLDNIANGNWGGPPSYSASGNGPARPLGFRERLAAAAV